MYVSQPTIPQKELSAWDATKVSNPYELIKRIGGILWGKIFPMLVFYCSLVEGGGR